MLRGSSRGSDRSVMQRQSSGLSTKVGTDIGTTKSHPAKLFTRVVVDDDTHDWVPIAGQSGRACVLSGLNLAPSNPSRRVINHKTYDHYALLKELTVKKNYPLKKELSDHLIALSAKDVLSQSEKEELAYLGQLEAYLFK